MPPRLVDDEHLARTNALVSLTDELAIVLGPVAAGVGIAAFGFRGAFVFDAVTYALGLAVLPMVRLRPVRTAATTRRPTRCGSATRSRVGGSIARNGLLRRVVACTFAVHLLYGTALLAEPLYVRDILERSESVFAALQTAFGICLVAGGLLAARLGERLASFGWVAARRRAAPALTAIVYLGTPYVAVAFLGVSLWGVATAVISGPSRTVMQRSSPQRAHGRVLSADIVAGSAAELTGVAVAGVLVGAFGVPWSILGLGLGVTTAAVALQVANQRDPTCERARLPRWACPRPAARRRRRGPVRRAGGRPTRDRGGRTRAGRARWWSGRRRARCRRTHGRRSGPGCRCRCSW